MWCRFTISSRVKFFEGGSLMLLFIKIWEGENEDVDERKKGWVVKMMVMVKEGSGRARNSLWLKVYTSSFDPTKKR